MIMDGAKDSPRSNASQISLPNGQIVHVGENDTQNDEHSTMWLQCHYSTVDVSVPQNIHPKLACEG